MNKIKNILIYTFLFIAFLGATRILYGPGYFNMHDDLQVMRIFELEKCFADGQIPCRWTPDMSWGYGQAMFNYYSAFPYYLGYFIRVFTPLSIMATVLLLFNISIVASGFGMFLLAKRFWGKLGGVVASVLYVYAPYHLLDIYIRGALSEAFALAILPFLWISLYSYIESPKFKNFAFSSIALSLLLTTHNLSTLMYAPFTAIWVIYWLLVKGSWKVFWGLSASILLSIGMAAFFFLPVVFERNLIQTDFLTMDYLNYEAHFVTIKQLFTERKWGHGPSIYGPEDDLSFQIGWPHWFLIVPLILVALRSSKNKKDLKVTVLIFGLLGLFLLAAFLTHSRSIFIWKAFPTISIVQFPWRFLGISAFFVSFAVSGIFYYKFKLRKLYFLLIVFLTIILNFNYVIPWDRSYGVKDEDKLSGLAFDLQRRSAILDYLPKTTKVAPKEAAFTEPRITKGEGSVSNYKVTSSTFSFDAEVYSEDAEFQVPVLYFPNWIVVSGGKIIPHSVTGDYGLIAVIMPEGKHILEGRFTDTPIRVAGNIISILSVITLFGIYLYTANKKHEI